MLQVTEANIFIRTREQGREINEVKLEKSVKFESYAILSILQKKKHEFNSIFCAWIPGDTIVFIQQNE